MADKADEWEKFSKEEIEAMHDGKSCQCPFCNEMALKCTQVKPVEIYRCESCEFQEGPLLPYIPKMALAQHYGERLIMQIEILTEKIQKNTQMVATIKALLSKQVNF